MDQDLRLLERLDPARAAEKRFRHLGPKLGEVVDPSWYRAADYKDHFRLISRPLNCQFLMLVDDVYRYHGYCVKVRDREETLIFELRKHESHRTETLHGILPIAFGARFDYVPFYRSFVLNNGDILRTSYTMAYKRGLWLSWHL
jgi:hypothetical protein